MFKGIVFIIISFFVLSPSASVYVDYLQNCEGYLKQAADANSVELASQRLDKAIEYVEARGWTKGYTSVCVQTEDDNIGYWYQNLKSCQKELRECANKTQLEKSNVLMKVRESLTDNGSDGTKLTVPEGLYKYPNVVWYSILNAIAVILFLCGGLIIYAKWDD